MGGRGASLGGTQGAGEAASPRPITPIAGIRTSKPMQEIIDNIGDTVEIIKILKPIYNFKACE